MGPPEKAQGYDMGQPITYMQALWRARGDFRWRVASEPMAGPCKLNGGVHIALVLAVQKKLL